MELLLIIVLVVGVVSFVIYGSKIKGDIGELKLSFMLKFLDKEKYHIFNDLCIAYGDRTSQIDHVVVSPYGIFVIETKNYKGSISGSFKSDKWTQNIRGNKYSMPNPIQQNKAHIYALKTVLPAYAQSECVSIVAFSSRASLFVTTDETEVIYIREILTTIKAYQKEVFTSEQVEEICNVIDLSNITDNEVREMHNVAAQRKVNNHKAKIEAGICPRCGSELVRRTGRYGSFIGCSNYPQCKFTTK